MCVIYSVSNVRTECRAGFKPRAPDTGDVNKLRNHDLRENLSAEQGPPGFRKLKDTLGFGFQRARSALLRVSEYGSRLCEAHLAAVPP